MFSNNNEIKTVLHNIYLMNSTATYLSIWFLYATLSYWNTCGNFKTSSNVFW